MIHEVLCQKLKDIADKSYAVANAHNDLKQYATEVILSNDEDGVARWLEANYKQ